MGKALCQRHDAARAAVAEADQALGFSLSPLMREGPLEELSLTENAQLAASDAMASTMRLSPCSC